MDRSNSESLFSRIFFDLGLERKAFARLAAADSPGCRDCLAELVDRLELPESRKTAAETIQLLADVLQRVNLELHRRGLDAATYEANRAELYRRFAGHREVGRAHRLFLPLLDQLLASPRDGDRRETLATRARSHIERHYPRRLSLSSVAAELNVSPNNLCRSFRRETGMTLTAYIQRVRLERARALLAEGGRRLSEVAYLVGYQNYRDFYRNFVKYEKASPRAVQKKLYRSSRVS